MTDQVLQQQSAAEKDDRHGSDGTNKNPFCSINGTTVLSYEEFMQLSAHGTLRRVDKVPNATATVVYTSGTTAQPKGVVLTHENIMSQVKYNSFNRANGGRGDPK